MKLGIWIWRHDGDAVGATRLYPTRQAAREALHNYVREQWDEGLMEDYEFTGNYDIDVNLYFEEHAGHEYHSITSQVVEFPDIPEPLLIDDVILSPEECATAIYALEQVRRVEVAHKFDTDVKSAAKIIASVHAKLDE